MPIRSILFCPFFLVLSIVVFPISGFAQRLDARLSKTISTFEIANGKYSNSTIVIRNSLLGVARLNINSLLPHSRVSTNDNGKSSESSNETLYLGSGILKLRRGLSVFDKDSRNVLTAISAQLNPSKGFTYLRLRFNKARKSGRVFEITVPLGSASARVRQISMRALSSKLCGFSQPLKTKLPRSAILADSNRTSVNLARLAAASSSTKIFTVTTDCDFECYTKLGQTQANDRILEFFNSVSTIYSADLDYGFRVVSQVTRTSSDSYPSSVNNAESLLTLLQSKAPSLASADLKHLITGKSMKNSVVGLSYVGVVCAQPTFSLGYSQHINSLLTPIILAHEIGHNFNAEHDSNNQGIMSAVLSSPYPSAFSTLSKSEISSFVNKLGGRACFDGGVRSSSSSSSSNSNSSGGGSNTGGDLSAMVSSRFSKSKFSASIQQSRGTSCSVSLKVAKSEAALASNSASVFSATISEAEQISLVAENMPKVKVKRAGLKASIWVEVSTNCSEGTARSLSKSINLAIAPQKTADKNTVSNTKAWINLLKKSIKRV